MIIGNCSECNGAAIMPHAGKGETVTCFTCNGFGKRNERTFSAYKTQALANRYGKRNCSTCKGSGLYTFPLTDICYSCHDNPGKAVIEISAGDILPDEIGRCGHTREAKISGVQFVVTRSTQGLTWGESYLGLGSLVSVTDYGTAWNNLDEASLIAKAKEELANTQWTKVINEERRIVSVIAVIVKPNGYTIKSFDNGHFVSAPVVLPPTYTASVLDRSV